MSQSGLRRAQPCGTMLLMGWRAQNAWDKAQKEADRQWVASLSPRDRLRFRVWQACNIGILVCVVLLMFVILFQGRAQAQPLPFPNGRYVTDQRLCSMPQDRQLAEFGDQLAGMERQISGRDLSGYDWSCQIGRVRISPPVVRFDAVCNVEEDKVREQMTYVIVSPTSFRIGSKTFSLCRTAPQVVDQPSQKNTKPELQWISKDFSRWAMNWLTKLYNREHVKFYDRNIDWQNTPFEVAEVQLRERPEGNPDLIVRWHESAWCGTGGCRTDVWLYRNDNYFQALSVLTHDVELGDGYNLGIRDLWFSDNRWRWTGKTYDRR